MGYRFAANRSLTWTSLTTLFFSKKQKSNCSCYSTLYNIKAEKAVIIVKVSKIKSMATSDVADIEMQRQSN